MTTPLGQSSVKQRNFKQQWQQLQARFVALKAREQILVTGAGAAILLALCDQLFLTPLTHANTLQKNQIIAVQQQLDQIKAERATVDAKLAEDPDAELHRSLDAVSARLAQQNEQLTKLTVDLIPPEAMAGVLRKMLGERRNLQLLALHNEAAVPAFKPREQTADAATTATEANSTATTVAASAEATTNGAGANTNGAADNNGQPHVAIYRHGLTLELKGHYLDIVEYLQALEQLPWHFYWEALDYKVDSYPNAIVTLKIYTLSNRESWIGA